VNKAALLQTSHPKHVRRTAASLGRQNALTVLQNPHRLKQVRVEATAQKVPTVDLNRRASPLKQRPRNVHEPIAEKEEGEEEPVGVACGEEEVED